MTGNIFGKYLQPISVLHKKLRQKQLWSIGFFAAVSISLISASLILINNFRYVDVNNIMVERQILSTPVLVIGLLLSLFLGITASVNLSREYDKGTLELLLYGPVDEVAFILGNFWAQISLFGWTMVGVFIWSNIIIWMFNLAFDLSLLLILLGCVIMAVEIVAFGLLTAVLGGKTRNALVVYILVLAIFGGVQIGDTLVANLVLISGSTVTDPLLFLRNVLETANNVLRWVSPYAQLQRSVNALLVGAWPEYLLLLGLMLVEGSVLLFFSIRSLAAKGVRTTS